MTGLSVLPLRDVIDLAHKAGGEIMAMRPNITARDKPDGSQVTEADRRASDIIIHGLENMSPSFPVVSEERPDSENRQIIRDNDTYWVVDPLDGTLTYINGEDGFGVHIALVSDGEPVLGVVYFPSLGVTYYTGQDGKAYKETDTGEKSEISVNGKKGDGFTAAVNWRPAKQPEHLNGAPYQAVPGVGGQRLCFAAEGRTDIAVTEAGFSFWDVAAAHAVLRAAGGIFVEQDSGRPVTYKDESLTVKSAAGGNPEQVRFVFGDPQGKGRSPQPPKNGR